MYMENIYQTTHLNRSHYSVSLSEQEKLIVELAKRSDAESERLKRYLGHYQT